MDNALLKAELLEADFDGSSPDDVKCRGCNGPLCGDKTPKLFHGELLFVCHLGEAGTAVLANAAARTKRDDDPK